MPRYVHCGAGEASFWARWEGATVVPLTDAPWSPSARTTPERVRVEGLRWHVPVRPSKIVAIGRNYAAHAAERGAEVPAEPLYFLKPPSALVGPEEAIRHPAPGRHRVEHEGELAVVVGRRGRRIPVARAAEHVFGYTLMNDVTARDLQRSDRLFTRAKGFDTFAPVGPWVDTDLRPGAQVLRARVNGRIRQEASLERMVFGVPELLAYVSRVMTLEPGDLVATGTPAGVGPLMPGDRVEVELDELGTLGNPVVADEGASGKAERDVEG